MKRSFIFTLFLTGFMLLFTTSPAPAGNEPLRLLPGPGQQQTGLKNRPATQLRDIRGPVPLPEKKPWLLYGGAALALLVFSAAFFIILKKKRKKPQAPAITPWDRALTDLKNAADLKTGRPLQYTEQMSSILREYVGSRFGCKITRQTSTEFLRTLEEQKNSSIPSAWHDSLKNCFQLCDLAKFAHRVPDPQDLEDMEQSIISFIEETTPRKSREEDQQ